MENAIFCFQFAFSNLYLIVFLIFLKLCLGCIEACDVWKPSPNVQKSLTFFFFFTDYISDAEVLKATCQEVGSINEGIFDIRFNLNVYAPGNVQHLSHRYLLLKHDKILG